MLLGVFLAFYLTCVIQKGAELERRLQKVQPEGPEQLTIVGTRVEEPLQCLALAQGLEGCPGHESLPFQTHWLSGRLLTLLL